MKRLMSLAALAVAAMSVPVSAATWNQFLIRSVPGAVTPLAITDVAGVVTTQIDEAGEKTGYGTASYNGQSISTLGSVSYNRLDAGSKTPYLNIWVTDGTNYAVIAPNVYSSYGAGGAPITPDSNGLDIQSLGVNVYETNTSNLGWLTTGGLYNSAFQGLVHADGVTPVTVGELFSSLTIYGNTTLGGTGAPKAGYGVSLIFGDTQGNFTSPIPYMVSNVTASAAVPLPAAAWGGMALMGLLFVQQRNRASRTA